MKCDCANCPTHACYTKGVNCTGVPLEAVKEAYTEEELKLMQAAAKHTIHKNAASRKVSRLAKRFNKANA